MASLVKIISANDSQPGVSTVTNNLNLTRTLMSLLPEKVSQDVDGSKHHLQKNHLISPVEKCKVCGEQAARHIHYGGVSCYSCRAFFRRSIQNKTANTYICRRSKECQINLKTRKNCQYCRYQRCLGVGMKPSWVLSAQEREQRFRKSKAKKLKVEDDVWQDNILSDNSISQPQEDVVQIMGVPTGESSITLEPVKLESVLEVSNCSISAKETQAIATMSSLSPVLTTTAMTSNSMIGSSDTKHFVKLCYPSDGNSPVVTKWFVSPSTSGSAAPLDLSGEDDTQSNYSSTGSSVSTSSVSDEDSTVNSNISIYNEPEIKFTPEELFNLNKLVQSHDERYRSVSFGEQLIKEMIMCSMFGIPVSASAAINGYNLTIARITKIANHLECFSNLPNMDQNSLLKENADLLVSLRGAIFFDSRKKGMNQVLISLGIDDMESIKTMFAPLMREREQSLKHIDYSNFNTVQKVEKSPTEQRYMFLQGKVAETVSDDSIITTLLTYIILFSPDFCKLQDDRQVQFLQEQHIRMLERYIYSKSPRPQATHNLAIAMEAITNIREMADIKKNRAFTKQ